MNRDTVIRLVGCVAFSGEWRLESRHGEQVVARVAFSGEWRLESRHRGHLVGVGVWLAGSEFQPVALEHAVAAIVLLDPTQLDEVGDRLVDPFA